MKCKLELEFDSLEELKLFLTKDDVIQQQEIEIRPPEIRARERKTWTQYELETLVSFYKKGYRYKKIGEGLQRKTTAVANKISQLIREGNLEPRSKRHGRVYEY